MNGNLPCALLKGVGHTTEQCPKKVVVQPSTAVVVDGDGFTTVVNCRCKGKGTVSWQRKDKLNDITYIVDPNIGDEERCGLNVSDATFNQHNDDSESDIEEAFVEENPNSFKGASTPITESHVDISLLSQVCSKGFKAWDWTSNAKLCTKGCRIILGWNVDVVNVLVLSQTNQAMHVKIVHKASNKIMYCSFIYAGNKVSKRRVLWSELGLHKQVVRGCPWILLGDFNVALNLEDSYSGSSLLNSAMLEFKDCVSNIEVMDINSSGLHFTWNQKPKGGGGILRKLDRIIRNLEFLDAFPGAHAYFHPYRISDHSPAVLKIPNLPMNKPKPFKFFNFITHKSKFLEILASQWNVAVLGHHMYQVTSKLKALKKPLRKLVHDHGNLHDRVKKLRCELDEVQRALDLNPTDQVLCVEEAVYVQTFNEAVLDEERFLKQKAKIEWLDVGDSNSAYFHKSLKSRNQRSRIEVILNADNVEISGPNVPNPKDFNFYARGDVDSARVIRDSLEEFTRVSGLVPSLPKSTAFFCNVANHIKLSILHTMPFSEGKLPVIYLGVPLIPTRLFNMDCKFLVEKARNKIGDWKNKSLSFAGRLQLCSSTEDEQQYHKESVALTPYPQDDALTSKP
ncbi:RNA-directed DNA polymerase, eukaryota, reverse transcriptase zinc-binding domain protein [Tanacetum coccineum]|uniref:RNA-directed DNA polymerase, eukaryota, reverse transcriptase zinc-binding domain protein n=1 Tax=Tanacetum coccineum TaxID=301880 RepID=A0ABQ4XE13_9ASTR